MNLKVRFHFKKHPNLVFKMIIIMIIKSYFHSTGYKSILKSISVRMWNCDNFSTLCAF
jgi:hypothetical protein